MEQYAEYALTRINGTMSNIFAVLELMWAVNNVLEQRNVILIKVFAVLLIILIAKNVPHPINGTVFKKSAALQLILLPAMCPSLECCSKLHL